MYKLYKITNTVNGHTYIGMTKQSLKKRMRDHINVHCKRKSKLYSAMMKYGHEVFVIELINEYEIKSHCCEAERYYIKKFGYYNLASGGEGGFVIQDIDAWKQKLSKSRRGRKPAKGMKHTDKNKKKMSEASVKYWSTQQTYKWEDIKGLSHREAKEQYGISTTHYYRLKKRFETNDLKGT